MFILKKCFLTDIDECSDGTHGCDANATCINIGGGHGCTCKAGYELKFMTRDCIGNLQL